MNTVSEKMQHNSKKSSIILMLKLNTGKIGNQSYLLEPSYLFLTTSVTTFSYYVCWWFSVENLLWKRLYNEYISVLGKTSQFCYHDILCGLNINCVLVDIKYILLNISSNLVDISYFMVYISCDFVNISSALVKIVLWIISPVLENISFAFMNISSVLVESCFMYNGCVWYNVISCRITLNPMCRTIICVYIESLWNEQSCIYRNKHIILKMSE